MSNQPNQTLGQRIDAVLEPLYAEAEQHRTTIQQATAQQQALQKQIDEATRGLGMIEQRMAQVVRSLAQQEPVIAAAFSKSIADTSIPIEPTEEPHSPEIATQAQTQAESPLIIEDDQPQDEISCDSLPQGAGEKDEEPQEVVAASTPEPPIAQAIRSTAEPALSEEQVIAQVQSSRPAIELDPTADAAEVDAAAALLDAPPSKPQAPVDIAAAAERAAAAAKQLREKAASK